MGMSRKQLTLSIAIVIVVALLDIGPLPSWLLTLDSRHIGQLSTYELLEIQQDVRVTVLQALGGLALISGVVAAWSQIVNANQTLSLSRSARVTEVFAKAVEQLGADGLATRLGGLYALDKLARDNEKERPNIASIISAFARRMPADPLADTPSDTQAAVTLLASGLYSGYVDLRGARLRGADLASAHLRSASLDEAILDRADLTDADLSNASLTGADLRRTKLTGANLRHANLVSADLRNTEFDASQIEGAVIDTSTRMT
jgi:Pentapeptide repeats (8 copies)